MLLVIFFINNREYDNINQVDVEPVYNWIVLQISCVCFLLLHLLILLLSLLFMIFILSLLLLISQFRYFDFIIISVCYSVSFMGMIIFI